MFVSVIVPTYNGAEKLPGILKALSQQSFKDYELIVVIDGSTDNTIEILEKWQNQILSFKTITQQNKGRACVRNAGARAASGDLLIFFDDDMIPNIDCIEQHIKHHQYFSNSILTGSQIDIELPSQTDIQKYKAYLSRRWTEPILSFHQKPLDKPNLFITAANFSISKSLFIDLGGFDEQLTDAEDFDFAIKAYKRGIALYYKNEVFAHHNDQVSCESYIKRNRQYIAAHKKLAALKPWIIKEGFREPLKTPKGWRKIIYQFFCSKKWVQLVDKDFFKILPRWVRYRLYDLIISANGVFFPEKVSLNK
jgi:glycosyltransferase involved in cell wall biosynthesis